MRALLALALVAACGDPPPLTIKYALRSDGSQLCYSNLSTQTVTTACKDVAMLCKSVLDLRIVSSDSTQEYVKVCQEITGRQNLCSIAGIDLGSTLVSIPEQDLWVEVAVFVENDLPIDPATGAPICPEVSFGDDGLPTSSSPSPAVGGRAPYHPGDSSTVVELGCTDQPALQAASCTGMNAIEVTATVNDFDSEVSVPPTLADNLSVSIGEPEVVTVGTTTQYALPPSKVHTLDRTVSGPTPAWGGAIDLQLVASACVEVLEDVPEATPSLVCKQVGVGQMAIDLPGVRVAKTTVDQILAAMRLTQFPPEGLVIGIVLDALGNPVPGVTITTSDGSTVSALTADRTQAFLGPTTTTGIFMSTTARYGTTFTAAGPGTNQPSAFGGLVAGKVTVVVLQYTQPTQP